MLLNAAYGIWICGIYKGTAVLGPYVRLHGDVSGCMLPLPVCSPCLTGVTNFHPLLSGRGQRRTGDDCKPVYKLLQGCDR